MKFVSLFISMFLTAQAFAGTPKPKCGEGVLCKVEKKKTKCGEGVLCKPH